ncbi:MAG: glycosyltransferase, partial [Anaerolineae bacterium]
LAQQTTSKHCEVLLVDSSDDGTAAFVEQAFPDVRLFHFPDRKYCGGARNHGTLMARADIVAFIDADCEAHEDWVAEILKVHESGDTVAGGAIANANPESYVGWAAYFCEFSRWMPGTPAQWMDDIAGANVTYRKALVDEYGGFIEETYCSDTAFHWCIGRHGLRLRFRPTMVVSHHSIDGTARFLSHEFRHGRSFGRVRVREKRFSAARRAAYVLGAPLIPLRILGKIWGNNLRNRVYLRHFILSLPLLVPGVMCWSMGEVVSYLGL